ncbi:MAG TPA: uroporphyrinogen-III C-methyltransferase [Usitatibacter sp.]|nr:uroporphyrinogen-III C-methyltransferase [Usitatibacter sp.]
MGKVYLVGAGPGAPDLLTLRAARLLEAADVVLHDALVHPDTLALAKGARLVDVGKRYGRVSTEQRFIHRVLVHAARHHEVVVRLKGGDPMLFGRAQEELDALAEAGIEAEVVPGVTAALAAASSLRVSLTRRGLARSVAFLTPRVGRGESGSDWVAAAMGADSIALYMAAGAAPAIAQSLLEAGKPAATPVALVESATLAEERVTYTSLAELRDIALAPAAGPVVMLLGDVLREAAARASGDDSESLSLIA